MGDVDIPFEASNGYLGVFLCNSKEFKMSASQPRAAFYKALNGLLSKGRGKFDDVVMLHLIKTFCLPLLVYGSECLNYSSSYYVAIRRSWNYMFWRLFRINGNSSVITEVCNWTHIMNIDDILRKRSSNFKLKIFKQ